MTATKGARTRQRIIERAAPVFNRQGYAGASLRDLVAATGLEKGGIYNHFGSKEQLALEAFDHAMAKVTGAILRAHERAPDACARLVAMVRTFATSARRPAVAGGCPIMNAAIEADDTNPDLRDRARHAMHTWHRLIGRTVKDGIADGTIDRATDPFALASLLTGALEGALMLSRLFDDPRHMDRVVDHLVEHVEMMRVRPPSSEGTEP